MNVVELTPMAENSLGGVGHVTQIIPLPDGTVIKILAPFQVVRGDLIVLPAVSIDQCTLSYNFSRWTPGHLTAGGHGWQWSRYFYGRDAQKTACEAVLSYDADPNTSWEKVTEQFTTWVNTTFTRRRR